MKNKIVGLLLAAAVSVSAVATGCSGSGTASSGKVSITFLNSKGEISTQLEKMAKAFNSTNKDGITVAVSSVSSSSTVDETMLSKYASGNPCTLNMVDSQDIATFSSRSLDLSNESWVKNIASSIKSTTMYKGKVMAFPLDVEGYGLIYNKTTIEKATGKTFDPSSIKSLSDLKALYREIQAGGVAPVEISHEDWSIGGHFLGTLFALQNYSFYTSKLKAGTADIATNSDYSGMMDLLDLNKTYNIYKSSPMSSDYNTTDPQNIATGKAAFWFNGNWVWPNVEQFLTGSHANDELGIMPMFINSKLSSSIVAGAGKMILIDKTKSTAAQQKAAKEFLKWIVTSKAGQTYLVKDMGLASAFTNITITPNGLSKSIESYIKAGKVVPGISLPGDFGTKIGAYMQQYLVGKTSRAELAKEVDSYYKS